jgi:hypothetical protein
LHVTRITPENADVDGCHALKCVPLTMMGFKDPIPKTGSFALKAGSSFRAFRSRCTLGSL